MAFPTPAPAAATVSALVTLCTTLLTFQLALAFVPKSELFPFGTANGDKYLQVVLDGFAGPIPSPFPVPFLGKTYSQVYVSTNGVVSFTQGILTFTPNCGALPEKLPMLTPFWADVDIRNGGNVSYRWTNSQTYLQKAKVDILKAFPTYATSTLKALFIATWDRVPFLGGGPLSLGKGCVGSKKTNTFQLALATDGTYSFVLIYYNDINWTTGTDSGGTCSGLLGIPAKAGFDLGDGSTFYGIAGSCKNAILNVTNTSNIGEAGKWVFGVHGAKLENGTSPSVPTTTEEPPPSTTTTTTQTPPPTTTTAQPPEPQPIPSLNCSTIDEGSPCEEMNCHRCGFCMNRTSYFYRCDMTQLTINGFNGVYVKEECHGGLWWNPDAVSVANSHYGTCDFWENLSSAVQHSYQADLTCSPNSLRCDWFQEEECSPNYKFTDPKRGITAQGFSCPSHDDDEGTGVVAEQLLWDNVTKSCQKCEFVRSKATGSPCPCGSSSSAIAGNGSESTTNSTATASNFSSTTTTTTTLPPSHAYPAAAG